MDPDLNWTVTKNAGGVVNMPEQLIRIQFIGHLPTTQDRVGSQQIV